MAQIHIITKQELEAKRRSEFRFVCTGLSKKEMASLYRTLKQQFGFKVWLRNPFPPEFDAKAVHELTAWVMGSAVGGYAMKKAIDAAQELLVAYLKFKMLGDPQNEAGAEVVLYLPDGSTRKFKAKRGKAK